MLLRSTFFFEFGKYGWTETFFSTRGTLDQAMTDARALLPRRIALLGHDVHLIAIRVSDDDVRGDSVFYPVPPNDDYNKNATGTQQINAAYDAVELRMTTEPLSRRIFILRGIDDDIQQGGVFTPNGAWATAFPLWKTALTGGAFGLKKVTRPGDQKHIAAMTQDFAAGTVTCVTVEPLTGWFHGDYITILGGSGAPGLRGQYRVQIIATNTFKINTRVNVANQNGLWIARRNLYTIVPFVAIDVLRLGKRDTGRPSFGPRGRRRGRARV